MPCSFKRSTTARRKIRLLVIGALVGLLQHVAARMNR
jgi:hypothetical protein